MARFALLLSFALVGLVSSRTPTPQNRNEDLEEIPGYDGTVDQGLTPVNPVANPFGKSSIHQLFQEAQQSRHEGESRIQVGKVVVNPPSFMAALQLSGRSNSNFCTASLLSKDRILTAAHCFNPEWTRTEVMQVVLGLSDLTDTSISNNKDKPTVSIVDFTFADVEIHKNYSGAPENFNDIAIIRLPSPVKDSHTPITMASDDTFKTNLIADGWGMKNSMESSTDGLREANGIYVEREKCLKKWDVLETQLCALFESEGKPVGIARGDSGGPLYSVVNPSEPVQIGIASYVATEKNKPPPGEDKPWATDVKVPAVYTRISEFKKFIRDNAPEAKFSS